MTSTKPGRLVFFNGEFVPESEARISIYDSALMFGDVVFEMTRSFNKKQFRLREHLERLYASARWLRIPIDMPIDEMEQHCHEAVEANDPLFRENDEHRLMIDVTRGLLGIYEGVVGGHVGTNTIIADFPLRWTVQHSAHLYTEGIDAVIPAQRMIPAQLLEAKAKNRNRIHYLMANIELSNYSGRNAWALLLDPDGFVAEGTGSNFFIVKDNVLFTPEPRNILRGISRACIFELAEELGLECYERNLEPYDVMMADEAFFCCTPFCMLPVVKFNGVNLGRGSEVGPVYKRLIGCWSDNVGVDIIAQAQKWAAEVATEGVGRPTPYEFKKK